MLRIVKQNALAICALLSCAAAVAVTGCHVGELVDSGDPNPSGEDTTPPDSSDGQVPTVNATHLVFLDQPGDVMAGEAISTVRIEARNDDKEAVTEFSGTVTISIASGPEGALLRGDLEREATSGVVEFDDLVVERASSDYTIAVAANELEGAVSESFAVGPANAAAIEVASGDDQADSVAATLAAPFVVRVLDEFENGVPDVAVTWEVVRGQGSVAAGEVRTAEDGLVDARYTLGTTAGEQIVVAAVVGLADVTATFVSHARPGQPVAVVVTEQPTNTGTGDPIAPPVIARIMDQFGNTATQADQAVNVGLAPFTGTPLASLSGTRSRAPVAGFVTFDDLSINLPGIGYRLRFELEGLSRDSRAFNVF